MRPLAFKPKNKHLAFCSRMGFPFDMNSKVKGEGGGTPPFKAQKGIMKREKGKGLKGGSGMLRGPGRGFPLHTGSDDILIYKYIDTKIVRQVFIPCLRVP